MKTENSQGSEGQVRQFARKAWQLYDRFSGADKLKATILEHAGKREFLLTQYQEIVRDNSDRLHQMSLDAQAQLKAATAQIPSDLSTRMPNNVAQKGAELYRDHLLAEQVDQVTELTQELSHAERRGQAAGQAVEVVQGVSTLLNGPISQEALGNFKAFAEFASHALVGRQAVVDGEIRRIIDVFHEDLKNPSDILETVPGLARRASPTVTRLLDRATEGGLALVAKTLLQQKLAGVNINEAADIEKVCASMLANLPEDEFRKMYMPIAVQRIVEEKIRTAVVPQNPSQK